MPPPEMPQSTGELLGRSGVQGFDEACWSNDAIALLDEVAQYLDGWRIVANGDRHPAGLAETVASGRSTGERQSLVVRFRQLDAHGGVGAGLGRARVAHPEKHK